MTVDELIDFLEKLPGKLPVYATWEGVFVEVRSENIGVNLLRPILMKHDALIIQVDLD